MSGESLVIPSSKGPSFALSQNCKSTPSSPLMSARVVNPRPQFYLYSCGMHEVRDQSGRDSDRSRKPHDVKRSKRSGDI